MREARGVGSRFGKNERGGLRSNKRPGRCFASIEGGCTLAGSGRPAGFGALGRWGQPDLGQLEGAWGCYGTGHSAFWHLGTLELLRH